MANTILMGVIDTLTRSHENIQQTGEGIFFSVTGTVFLQLFQYGSQGFAGDTFHGKVGPGIFKDSDTVDRNNVGMGDPGSDTGFPDKAVPECGITFGQIQAQNFLCPLNVEKCVSDQINFPHATFADTLLDPVFINSVSHLKQL
jgi:hypothetical protein